MPNEGLFTEETLESRHAATCGKTLQITAIRSNTVQHSATQCNTLQHTDSEKISAQRGLSHIETSCSVLQFVAVWYSVL